MSNVLHPVVTEFERLLNSDEILMADFMRPLWSLQNACTDYEKSRRYECKVTVVKIDG